MNPFFGKKIGLVGLVKDIELAGKMESLGAQVFARSTGTDLDFVVYGEKVGTIDHVTCYPLTAAEGWIEKEGSNPTPIDKSVLVDLTVGGKDFTPEMTSYLLRTLATEKLVGVITRDIKSANLAALTRSANRWDALMLSPAIRQLGNSGLSGDSTDKPYAHLGLELWTIHSGRLLGSPETEVGKQRLTDYADRMIDNLSKALERTVGIDFTAVGTGDLSDFEGYFVGEGIHMQIPRDLFLDIYSTEGTEAQLAMAKDAADRRGICTNVILVAEYKTRYSTLSDIYNRGK